MTSAPQGRAELDQLSVRELIVELAQLEHDSPTSSPLFCDVEDHCACPRTREGRIIAELRRRHAALRWWGFLDSRVTTNCAGGPVPGQDRAIQAPPGARSESPCGEEESWPV